MIFKAHGMPDLVIDRFLKFSPHQNINFGLYMIDPPRKKVHYIFDHIEGKHIVKDCANTKLGMTECVFCKKAGELFHQKASIQELQKWWPVSHYFLPAIIEKNNWGIEEGEYIFKFGEVIRNAYGQLFICHGKYNFDGSKPLQFFHRASKEKNPFLKCYFKFGDTKITVNKLCKDAKAMDFFPWELLFI